MSVAFIVFLLRFSASTCVFRSVAPALVEAQIKFCNFERRQKNFDAADAVFVSALSTASAETRPFITMQYARFLERVSTRTPLTCLIWSRRALLPA